MIRNQLLILKFLSSLATIILCHVTFASNQNQLYISADVVPSCDVTINDLNFGIYNQSILEQITNISIICTKGTHYTIGINSGRSNGSTNNIRSMQKSNYRLKYSIYQNSGMNKTWGNSGQDSVLGIGTGETQHIPVYAKIFDRQNLPKGMYHDELSIIFTIGSTANAMSYQLSFQMQVMAELSS